MFGIGMGELIVIFVVVLLLFGPKALPELAKGLGQAIRMFKREAKEIKDAVDSDDAPSQSASASVDFDPDASKRDWRPKTGEESRDA